jgi:NAD-dependent dihydropyrimidine dehydrogenase PreA subunit
MDKETPNDNNSASKISLNIPIDAISPFDDIARIQNAIRKTAGVRMVACSKCGKCFFICIMGNLLEGKEKENLLKEQLPVMPLDLME